MYYDLFVVVPIFNVKWNHILKNDFRYHNIKLKKKKLLKLRF